MNDFLRKSLKIAKNEKDLFMNKIFLESYPNSKSGEISLDQSIS